MLVARFAQHRMKWFTHWFCSVPVVQRFNMHQPWCRLLKASCFTAIAGPVDCFHVPLSVSRLWFVRETAENAQQLIPRQVSKSLGTVKQAWRLSIAALRCRCTQSMCITDRQRVPRTDKRAHKQYLKGVRWVGSAQNHSIVSGSQLGSVLACSCRT